MQWYPVALWIPMPHAPEAIMRRGSRREYKDSIIVVLQGSNTQDFSPGYFGL